MQSRFALPDVGVIYHLLALAYVRILFIDAICNP